MLLSLLGIPTTGTEALGLFGLKRSNPSYAGASQLDIGSVFASVTQVRRWYWECHKRFNFALVSESLRAQLYSNNYPTLLSFGAIHKNGDWRCFHVVVVIRVTDELIEVLDPLGARPRRHKGNVWFQRAVWPKPLRVIGNSYTINPKSEAAVLRWAAGNSPHRQKKSGGPS